MIGSNAYMAVNRACAERIGREGRILARVVADFSLVQFQLGDDRTDIVAPGERPDGDGV